MKRKYRFINHIADVGIKVYGSSCNELFRNGALALYDLLVDISTVLPKEEHKITVQGEDLTDLWVNFLREALSLFHIEKVVCCNCYVAVINTGYGEAIMYGETLDLNRHRLKQEIKAVTYHQAYVKKTSTYWVGQVIFDV